MKKRLFLCICLLHISVRADLSTHELFKHYIGSWKAAGELKGTDGNTVTITQEWTGVADGPNSFLIEGTRKLNGNQEPFKWIITHDPVADTFDAVLTGVDPQNSLRFEGSVSRVNFTLELKAITGNGSGAITILDSFPTEKKDTIDSKVTFTGDSGQTTLEGTIKHEKQKAP